MEKKQYIKTLKLNKETLDFIESAMDAYSEDGHLYDEFGIKEYCNLYSLYIYFDDKCTVTIHLNSGKCNCYIDYIFYNANGTCIDSFVGDDNLAEGDFIEFIFDDAVYIVKVESM